MATRRGESGEVALFSVTREESILYLLSLFVTDHSCRIRHFMTRCVLVLVHAEPAVGCTAWNAGHKLQVAVVLAHVEPIRTHLHRESPINLTGTSLAQQGRQGSCTDVQPSLSTVSARLSWERILGFCLGTVRRRGGCVWWKEKRATDLAGSCLCWIASEVWAAERRPRGT